METWLWHINTWDVETPEVTESVFVI